MLVELIKSLNKKEQKLFLKYIQHKVQNRKNRKDVMIFKNLLNSGKHETKALIKQLYGEYDRAYADSFYSLKNILKTQLENFILQQKDNSQPQLQISRFVNLSQKLYYNKKYKPAWNYLEAAESIAMKAEEYELLNQIYQNMIEYAWTQPIAELEKVINKENENREQAQTIRKMNLALSVVQNRLRYYYTKDENPNIEKIVEEVLKEYKVDEIVVQKASEKYKLALIVKVNLEERNDYEKLYKYIIKILQEMEEAKMFNKHNYKYKIELLNIICYASARSGKYEISQKYIQIIERENKIYPKTDLLTIRSSMAKVVCLGLTGRVKESLGVLEYLKVKHKTLYKDDDYFFITLNNNLLSAYLQLEDLPMARKCLNELLNYSQRVIRYSGLKNLLYCQITECMLAIDLKEMDYVESRLVSIERRFKEFLKQTHNKRNQDFLKLLRWIANNNSAWNKEKFKSEVWKFIFLQPIYNPGDEFISFNAWLYSKLEKVPYSEAGYNKAMEEKMKDGKSIVGDENVL